MYMRHFEVADLQTSRTDTTHKVSHACRAEPASRVSTVEGQTEHCAERQMKTEHDKGDIKTR